MANGFYTKMQESYGMDGNTTASVRKLECPRCGFKFSLCYARAIACQGCSEATRGCPKVRCNKCDYEFELIQHQDVLNELQERSLADHICQIVNQRYSDRGIERINRRSSGYSPIHRSLEFVCFCGRNRRHLLFIGRLRC